MGALQELSCRRTETATTDMKQTYGQAAVALSPFYAGATGGHHKYPESESKANWTATNNRANRQTSCQASQSGTSGFAAYGLAFGGDRLGMRSGLDRRTGDNAW